MEQSRGCHETLVYFYSELFWEGGIGMMRRNLAVASILFGAWIGVCALMFALRYTVEQKEDTPIPVMAAAAEASPNQGFIKLDDGIKQEKPNA